MRRIRSTPLLPFLVLGLVVPVLVACGGREAPAPGDDDGGTDEATGPQVVMEAVAYEHDGTALEGVLAYDENQSGKRPGILVIHEWWGLDTHPKERARRLAELGYVAFCVDMYGKGKLTDDPAQAKEWATAFYSDPHGFGRKRILAGLEVLRKDPRVDPERIGAIGFCYGGSVALELAWSGADVDGVVVFHGNLIAPPEADAKSVKAAVLVCNGAADAWIPPAAVASFGEALTAAGIEHEIHNYEGAVHAFTNPGANERGMDNVAYDEKADAESWKAMKAFFAERF